MDELEVTLITDWVRFRDLSSEWDRLLGRSSSKTIFLTWDWVISWITVWEKHYDPYVIVVRDNNKALVGVIPLYKTRFCFLGLIRYTVLRTIGDHDTGFEYPSWLIDKDKESVLFPFLLNELNMHKNDWDCIWMPRVSSIEKEKNSFIALIESKDIFINIRPHLFSGVDLPKNILQYEHGLSKNRRNQKKRQTKKIMSNQSVKITQCNSERNCLEFLDALVTLNHKRWKHAGQNGTFIKKPKEAEFYKIFVPRAFKNSWLKFYALYDSQDIKAIQMGFLYDNIFHQLQEGFDPNYSGGVGNVLRWHVIGDCIGSGIQFYDFLGGNADEHKKRWGAKERTGCDIFIGNKKIKNYLLFFKKIWPTGRFFQPCAVSRKKSF